MRWIMRLQAFDLDVRHRKGAHSGNVDALTRGPNLGERPYNEDAVEPLYENVDQEAVVQDQEIGEPVAMVLTDEVKEALDFLDTLDVQMLTPDCADQPEPVALPVTRKRAKTHSEPAVSVPAPSSSPSSISEASPIAGATSSSVPSLPTAIVCECRRRNTVLRLQRRQGGLNSRSVDIRAKGCHFEADAVCEIQNWTPTREANCLSATI